MNSNSINIPRLLFLTLGFFVVISFMWVIVIWEIVLYFNCHAQVEKIIYLGCTIGFVRTLTDWIKNPASYFQPK